MRQKGEKGDPGRPGLKGNKDTAGMIGCKIKFKIVNHLGPVVQN